MKQKVISGITMTAFAVTGLVFGQAATAPSAVILKVNGEPVTVSNVRLAEAGLQRQMGQQQGKVSKEEIIKAATDRVVNEKLLAQEAARQKFQPNKAKVDQGMSQLVKQAGGRAKLDAMLAKSGVTYDGYRNAMLEMDLVQQFVDKTIAPTVKVSAEDAKGFYDKNPQYFKRPEQVHARHILFTVKPDAPAAAKKAARDKAEAARQRALKGEDFGKLAQELSQGPSAKNGGDLGFFGKQQMVKPFAEAAFALQPGQISDVVETRFGYHVIKVEERRPAGKQDFADVKGRIEGFLQQQKVGEAVRTLVAKLRSKAKIEQLTPAAAPAAAPKGK